MGKAVAAVVADEDLAGLADCNAFHSSAGEALVNHGVRALSVLGDEPAATERVVGDVYVAGFIRRYVDRVPESRRVRELRRGCAVRVLLDRDAGVVGNIEVAEL